MKLKTEVWRSNENQQEVHLFIPSSRNQYVLGFNPEIISEQEVEKFLDEKGFHFDRSQEQ